MKAQREGASAAEPDEAEKLSWYWVWSRWLKQASLYSSIEVNKCGMFVSIHLKVKT